MSIWLFVFVGLAALAMIAAFYILDYCNAQERDMLNGITMIDPKEKEAEQ